MSQNLEEKTTALGKIAKKASKKTTSQIPLDALGFKGKVFYDATYEYIPRRKQNKYAKYFNSLKKGMRSKNANRISGQNYPA